MQADTMSAGMAFHGSEAKKSEAMRCSSWFFQEVSMCFSMPPNLLPCVRYGSCRLTAAHDVAQRVIQSYFVVQVVEPAAIYVVVVQCGVVDFGDEDESGILCFYLCKWPIARTPREPFRPYRSGSRRCPCLPKTAVCGASCATCRGWGRSGRHVRRGSLRRSSASRFRTSRLYSGGHQSGRCQWLWPGIPGSSLGHRLSCRSGRAVPLRGCSRSYCPG